MKRASLLLAFVLAGTPAFAQWHYQGEDSAFGSSGTHIAVTANGVYGFGLRCQNGDVAAVYITPEDATQDQAAAISLGGAKLLVRVDDLPPHELGGEIESYNGKLRMSVPVESALTSQLRDAKRRIAVAISGGGELYHEGNFSARGSTKAIERVLKGCGTE